MSYDEKKPELDPGIIILGLGYASAILVLIGWVATI